MMHKSFRLVLGIILGLILFLGTSALALEIPGGRYTVGEDIPAGSYTVSIIDGISVFSVWGSEYKNFDADGGRLLEIMLKSDGNPTIGKVTLSDGNIVDFDKPMLIEQYKGLDFSSSDTVDIPGGRYTVGQDIPAGSYTVSITDGISVFSVWGSEYKNFDADGGRLLEIMLKSDGNPTIGKVTLSDGNIVDFDKSMTFTSFSGFSFEEFTEPTSEPTFEPTSEPTSELNVESELITENTSVENKKEENSISDSFSPGGTVYFGHYEQDGKIENGNESIEWIVLDKSGDKILLLSKYCLEALPYHDDENVTDQIDWKQCSLNQWLNNDFFTTAFSESEQIAITPSEEVITDFESYFKNGAIYTDNPVFLLDSSEKKKYFPEEGDFYATPTIALYNSGKISGKWGDDGGYYVIWWLRGKALAFNEPVWGYSVSNQAVRAIRPAVWLDTSLYTPSIEREANQVIATPTPEPTATPTPEPTATPTPEPTATPTPKPTATPTPKPTATPTPKPTATPIVRETVDLVPGMRISYGEYTQGTSSSAKDPIVWRVLDVVDQKALVISEKALDVQAYGAAMDMDSYYEKGMCWRNSELNNWLNTVFFNTAFADAEESAIVETENATTDACGTNTSTDKIFCLSIEEANKYFANGKDMASKPTQYAYSKLKKDAGATDSEGYGLWWLRDMIKAYKGGSEYNEAAAINLTSGTGKKSKMAVPVFCDYLVCVRPAMRLDLTQIPVGTLKIVEDAQYETLQSGSKGEEVKKLQNRLNELGFSVGTADGAYGKKTKVAIQEFQKRNSLPVTGIADEDTQKAVYSSKALKPTATPKATTKPTPKPTAKPTKKPSSSSSSSSSAGLLSASDCKSIALAYLYARCPGAYVMLSDAANDGNNCVVAVQYSYNGSMRINAIVVDRRSGSVVYVQ